MSNILLPGKDEIARVSGIDPDLIESISEPGRSVRVGWLQTAWRTLPGFVIELRMNLDPDDITFEHLAKLAEHYKTRKINFVVDGGVVYDSCAIAGSVEIEVLFEEDDHD